MSDYTDLAKALRCCIDDNIPCPDCPRFNKCIADRNMSSLFSDAADAIEKLSKECKSLYAMLGTHPDPSGEPGDLGVLPQPPKPDIRYVLFVLDGCDISFVAAAPEDITLKQLLEQCDKIKPDYCACGIRPFYRGIDLDHTDYPPKKKPTQIVIGYDNIQKVSDDVPCQIVEHWRDKTYQWDGEIEEAEEGE